MNAITKLLIVALAFVTTTAMAQEFQGEATYKTQRKMNIQLDSSQVSSEMHERMMDMMKKQFEKTYILNFNKEESVYEEDEELEAPQPAGMQVVMVNTRGSDILYKNTKDQRFVSQNEVYGKIFLIEDKIEKRSWELSNETKNIGDYTCYKATFTREAPMVRGFISVNGDNDPDEDEEDAELKTETITVTAWYTPDIPVNNGPGRYDGLPGLILEVNDGPTTIMCSKIVLNPKNTLAIEAPSKGKKVNQKEYEAIMEKKAKEMRERFDSERNDGHNIKVRIGG